MHLLRGLSVGLGINYSCAEQWRPIAEEALFHAGRLKGGLFKLLSYRKLGLIFSSKLVHTCTHAYSCANSVMTKHVLQIASDGISELYPLSCFLISFHLHSHYQVRLSRLEVVGGVYQGHFGETDYLVSRCRLLLIRMNLLCFQNWF